jgi:hypothetical protein
MSFVIMMSVIMLCVILLNVVMLSVIRLSVISLNAVAPNKRNDCVFVSTKNRSEQNRAYIFFACFNAGAWAIKLFTDAINSVLQ